MAKEHRFPGSLSGLVGELRSNAFLATTHFATAKHNGYSCAAKQGAHIDHGGRRGDSNADSHSFSYSYPHNHGICHNES